MATYVIGDVHGCFRTLERLLGRLPFATGRDRLWLTGDLVNRGPSSLEVLRWGDAVSRDLGDRFVAVLGNHDLHLLASAAGIGRPQHQSSLAAVLDAPDRDRLLKWLARRPLMHRDDQAVLVHAGLYPDWTLRKASARAAKLEKLLRKTKSRAELLRAVAAGEGEASRDLFAFTGLRTLRKNGAICNFSGPPSRAPKGCRPWYRIPGRRSRKATIVAGHWAAQGVQVEENYLGLDSGCVYGGALTAVRLEDRKIYTQPNVEC